jgi:DNA primase
MSTKVTDHVIEEIRARVDIVELIGARMTLKKAGGTFKGCCPFHNEKTPSFNVNPVKQFYHCFGCGEHGDIFTFLMKQDGLSFMDAVRTLADRAGVAITQEVDYNAQNRNLLYAIHAELAAFYQRCLKQTQEAEIARRYLSSRKLSEEVVALFGIGYAPERPHDVLLQWGKKYSYSPEQLVAAGILTPPNKPDRPDDYYDRFRGRLMFPICDRQGRVVAFSARLLKERKNTGKYVNSPETDIFTKSRVLYALDKAAAKIVKHPRREAIICEGQIDVIRCHSAGFETAVASQGTAFTKEHVSLLKKHADSVVLVFDGDSAGRKAALRTGALFLEEEVPVRVAVLPTGDDPDSIIRDKGPDVFRELLENAQSITTFQIESLRQLETQPDSIDALNRVTRDVLDMLAACPGAVLRSRLLQEASALLHIPYSALEDDLEKHREALRSRAAVAASYKDASSAAAAPSQAPYPADAPGSDERPPLSDDFSPESDSDQGFEHLDAPAPEPPSRTEYLLCEFLIEHEHDAEVLDLVESHLPLDIIPHPFARSVVDTLITQRLRGGDRLAELCKTTDPAWQPLLGSLLANKQKMLSAREMTSGEAARDFITAVWVMRFKQERGRLSADSSTENDRQRFSLSCLIKSLETQPWEQACKLMTTATSAAVRPEAPQDGQTVSGQADAGGAAAGLSGHGGGSASGASDPEEFPPSEYPPDER